MKINKVKASSLDSDINVVKWSSLGINSQCIIVIPWRWKYQIMPVQNEILTQDSWETSVNWCRLHNAVDNVTFHGRKLIKHFINSILSTPNWFYHELKWTSEQLNRTFENDFSEYSRLKDLEPRKRLHDKNSKSNQLSVDLKVNVFKV